MQGKIRNANMEKNDMKTKETRPEFRLAEVRRITDEIVRTYPFLSITDVGLWGVMTSGCVIKCHSYQGAVDLASSFNRCPA